MTAKFYNVLSLKRSPKNGQCVWWKPAGNGYTTDIDEAGIWSHEDILVDPEYLDNGTTSRAVDRDEVVNQRVSVVEWPLA